VTPAYIDLHCHPLPAVDDGCKSAQEGARLLVELGKIGFAVVVATPHVRAPQWNNTHETVAAARAELEKALAGEIANGAFVPEFHTAAEHLLDDVSWERLTGPNPMVYPGGRAALIEFDYEQLPLKAELRLWRLMKTYKIAPVLAHPERCAPLRRDREVLLNMVGAGGVPLLDVMSLTGTYGASAQARAVEWVKDGIYKAACSDSHKPADVAKVADAIAVLRSLVGESGVIELFVNGPSKLLGRVV
jgi:protein-tyrosine phosphatase